MNKTVSARISELPRRLGDPLPEVWVTFSNGTEKMLFTYYPDEISFQAEDFVGLTEEECRLFKVRAGPGFSAIRVKRHLSRGAPRYL